MKEHTEIGSWVSATGDFLCPLLTEVRDQVEGSITSVSNCRRVPFRIYTIIEKKRGGKLILGNYIFTVSGITQGGNIIGNLMEDVVEEKDGKLSTETSAVWSNDSIVNYYHAHQSYVDNANRSVLTLMPQYKFASWNGKLASAFLAVYIHNLYRLHKVQKTNYAELKTPDSWLSELLNCISAPKPEEPFSVLKKIADSPIYVHRFEEKLRTCNNNKQSNSSPRPQNDDKQHQVHCLQTQVHEIILPHVRPVVNPPESRRLQNLGPHCLGKHLVG